MTELPLTLSCGLYELTRPLADGEVKPEGIDLAVHTDDRSRIYSLKRHSAFDAGELNVTEFFRARDRGVALTGLPIFPHRRFRHGYVFVNPRNKKISGPQDLSGRPVGISGVTPAAGVWIRGILQDYHDVRLDSVDWHENPLEPISPDDQPAPDRTPVTEQLLLDGEIDALISPQIPIAFQQGDDRIARLFPSYKDLDIAYYREFGIFPIMHVVTIRTEIVERDPWVAESLLAAFDEAKRIAYERASNPRLTPLAFYEHAWEEQTALLGSDPWEYGLSPANRRNLETILRYTREQGRISREPDLDKLFV